MAGYGAGEHQPALAAGLLAHADKGAGAIQWANQVGAQNLHQLVVVHFGHRHAAHAGTGVGDENIRRAKLGRGLIEGGLHTLRLGNVAMDQQRAAPCLLNASSGLRRAILVTPIGDADVRSGAREAFGGGPANAGVAARDECHFGFELHDAATWMDDFAARWPRQCDRTRPFCAERGPAMEEGS